MTDFVSNEKNITNDEVLEVGYTTSDNPMRSPPIIDVNNECCYAKIVSTTSNKHLSIQTFVKATQTRNIIDPWNKTETLRSNRLVPGGNAYAFKKISKKGFDLYLLYLKTRNQVYLRDAEKELQNSTTK